MTNQGNTLDFFDRVLPTVRTLRNYLSDTDVARRIVTEHGLCTSEEAFLLIASAKVLDGPNENN